MRLFKLARRIPAVGNHIKEELGEIKKGFYKDVDARTKGVGYLTRLPKKPISDELITKEVARYLELGIKLLLFF